MELCGLLEEAEPRVGVHHILDQADKVLRDDVLPESLSQDEDELRGLVVVLERHPPPEGAEGVEGEERRLGVHRQPAGREQDALPAVVVAASLK